MEFGVFDHLDRNGLPLKDFYEARLRMAEAYDRGGFFCYHIAEHHMTPLGLASSPSVFLSSVAQRTRRLRFGPLVYTLPFHHPLGLIEEICMLDQLSNGRIQIGVGKGSSSIEIAYFGIKPEERADIYSEALDILLKGLASKQLDHHGKYFNFDAVPMELEPLQKPHPPVWQGVNTADSAARAGRSGYNIVTLASVREARAVSESHRAGWNSAKFASVSAPKCGLCRFVIVADTDHEALAIARRVYPKWHTNFNYLYRAHGTAPRQERPPEFDMTRDGGRGIAGSPETVAGILKSQIAESGIDYFVGQFAFGDMEFGETTRSIDLFVRYVMPEVRKISLNLQPALQVDA